MRAKALTLTLLLLLCLVPLGMPTAPAPPGLPSVSVDVEDIGEVQTDLVEYNHVSATGTVTVSNFALGTTVNVNATTNSVWMVTVDPETFTIPQGAPSSHTETVHLDIRVPPKASATTAVALTLFANATNAIGIEYSDEDTTYINVTQYYGVKLSTNNTMAVEQGKNLTHNMHVTNSGNGVDNFTVQLNNGATLTPKGLEVQFDGEVMNVGKDRMVSVRITVRAEDDAEVGTVEALFTVRSEGDPSKFDTYKLTITVRKATDGGNGGDGDGTDDGETTNNWGLYIGAGFLIVMLVLIVIFVTVVKRRVDEEEAAGAEDRLDLPR